MPEAILICGCNGNDVVRMHTTLHPCPNLPRRGSSDPQEQNEWDGHQLAQVSSKKQFHRPFHSL